MRRLIAFVLVVAVAVTTGVLVTAIAYFGLIHAFTGMINRLN